MSINPGFLLINKPEGWTSHDVVAKLRGILGIKKIGHAGTLDPFATGLLIIGVGREATKRLDEFKAMPKTYCAIVHLGEVSTTGDPTGEIAEQTSKEPSEWSKITWKGENFLDALAPNLKIRRAKINIGKTLKKFLGEQQQIPPMHSAKQIDGKRLYVFARKGEEIDRAPQNINIYDIEILNYKWPRLELKIKCSTGTYIRTLAEDIGKSLSVGAYCEKLKRTAIGEYKLKNAKKLNELYHKITFLPSV